MSQLIFVTTCSPDYSRPWIFPSLGMLRERVVCLLDPADDRPLPVNCERRDYRTVGTQHQDGRFVQRLTSEFGDGDVIVMLDADGVVQRPLDEQEKCFLWSASDDGTVWLGYNVRPGQKGAEEFLLLGPKKPIEDAAKCFKIDESVLREAPVYNTGVMAAKLGTWVQIYRQAYPIACNGAADLFTLKSWPQYLVCCVLAANKVPVKELGYATHSHGHFPLTPKHEIKNRQLYYKRQLVFFAHAVGGVTH